MAAARTLWTPSPQNTDGWACQGDSQKAGVILGCSCPASHPDLPRPTFTGQRVGREAETGSPGPTRAPQGGPVDESGQGRGGHRGTGLSFRTQPPLPVHSDTATNRHVLPLLVLPHHRSIDKNQFSANLSSQITRERGTGEKGWAVCPVSHCDMSGRGASHPPSHWQCLSPSVSFLLWAHRDLVRW